MKRPDRDEFFLSIAKLYAERSTCLRAKVGCVATIDNRIIGAGYVGSLSGQPHCLDAGCDVGPHGGCVRTTHAEMNLVASMARLGIALGDATIYATHSCCTTCARLLASCGISKFVFIETYRLEDLESLKLCGVECWKAVT